MFVTIFIMPHITTNAYGSFTPLLSVMKANFCNRSHANLPVEGSAIQPDFHRMSETRNSVAFCTNRRTNLTLFVRLGTKSNLHRRTLLYDTIQ